VNTGMCPLTGYAPVTCEQYVLYSMPNRRCFVFPIRLDPLVLYSPDPEPLSFIMYSDPLCQQYTTDVKTIGRYINAGNVDFIEIKPNVEGSFRMYPYLCQDMTPSQSAYFFPPVISDLKGLDKAFLSVM
jgi:hypothetical protein